MFYTETFKRQLYGEYSSTVTLLYFETGSFVWPILARRSIRWPSVTQNPKKAQAPCLPAQPLQNGSNKRLKPPARNPATPNSKYVGSSSVEAIPTKDPIPTALITSSACAHSVA